MLTIILCWIVISTAIIFVGRLFIRNASWYEYFWMGLTAIIAILQIWSIFLPVNIYALIAIFILGIFSIFIFRRIEIPKINVIRDWIVKNKLFLLITTFSLIVISYYASQPVGWDDTLLYHLNAVKWANLYAVVPGLANLHSRLGFNSSFFLFASMLDNWFMSDRSSHLALFILTAVLSVEFIWIFLRSGEKFLKFFCLFITPFLIYGIAKQEIIASLSPDFAVAIIVLAISVEFIKKEKSSVLIGALLSILLLPVKFSAVSFSAIILIFILFRHRNLWKWILGGGILLIVPYLIRNFYLSGWLLYPLPLFKFNVPWVVPAEQVKGVFTVIQTWARVPGTEWAKFIGASFWKWFPVWYQNNQGSTEVKIFVFSSVFVLISPLLKIFDKKFFYTNRNMIFLSFASLVSVLYVFFTAPDIRFGGVFVWVFFASVLSLYFSVLKWNVNVKILAMLVSVILTFFVSWPIRFDNEPILRSVRWEQAWPTKNVNGILMPTEQNLCGNSDLPCTPENNNIRERVPGDLSKGFVPIN